MVKVRRAAPPPPPRAAAGNRRGVGSRLQPLRVGTGRRSPLWPHPPTGGQAVRGGDGQRQDCLDLRGSLHRLRHLRQGGAPPIRCSPRLFGFPRWHRGPAGALAGEGNAEGWPALREGVQLPQACRETTSTGPPCCVLSAMGAGQLCSASAATARSTRALTGPAVAVPRPVSIRYPECRSVPLMPS